MPTRSWMWVGWPSFLMAGVLEMLVFAVVDPSELHWQGGALDWSRPAVYTLAFFVFWAVIALSSALSVWLAQDLRRRSAD
ncbi:MAG: hypothetical protein GTN84_20650 [Hydrogenophaga sp.]|uniref:hypothetical protein n=1 Tax=Hydrogenophaga sp. TaxID=1904254 RepID=UPI0016926526|nr:hypothetical protein [Hydrogenophaga sp.]NIM43652.1 hypothetical protein [Hydrogenophaga sp.]NIN28721.1 hypothetical protein [Hydrogenophaga sp.]NIN33180.1 hypothetical protein [Hydrogenophaga sp.]NIN57855.1 hypothetical protein [Hydrogenophaga sp.]NIO54150.1 hypothetical protein [Hydrogenophaga sp.]